VQHPTLWILKPELAMQELVPLHSGVTGVHAAKRAARDQDTEKEATLASVSFLMKWKPAMNKHARHSPSGEIGPSAAQLASQDLAADLDHVKTVMSDKLVAMEPPLKLKIALAPVDLGFNGDLGVLALNHVLEAYDPDQEVTTATWHQRLKQKHATQIQDRLATGVHGAAVL